MQNLSMSNLLALFTLVILFGYISYKEWGRTPGQNAISDEGVIGGELTPGDEITGLEESIHPLPAISFELPKTIAFAEEAVPLNIPDVRERLDKELQINCYLHSNTIFLMKRAHRWLPQMEAILRKYNIPDDFKYLPLIESNLLNVVSPRDAVGYWQILDTSGKEFGLEITKDVDERYDPLKATEAACKYLRQAYSKFGNWALVAASYNRGMGGMQRALESQKVKSYYDLFLNDETSRYVFRILAIKEIIEHPEKYGFRVKQAHLYNEEPLRYIEVTETIHDLIDFARDNGSNYKLLKRHNPWLREDNLNVKRGRSYRIALPKE